MIFVLFSYITWLVLAITCIASHIKNNKTKEGIAFVWRQLNCNSEIEKNTSSSQEFLPVSMNVSNRETAIKDIQKWKYGSNNTAFVCPQTSCS